MKKFVLELFEKKYESKTNNHIQIATFPFHKTSFPELVKSRRTNILVSKKVNTVFKYFKLNECY